MTFTPLKEFKLILILKGVVIFTYQLFGNFSNFHINQGNEMYQINEKTVFRFDRFYHSFSIPKAKNWNDVRT